MITKGRARKASCKRDMCEVLTDTRSTLLPPLSRVRKIESIGSRECFIDVFTRFSIAFTFMDVQFLKDALVCFRCAKRLLAYQDQHSPHLLHRSRASRSSTRNGCISVLCRWGPLYRKKKKGGTTLCGARKHRASWRLLCLTSRASRASGSIACR